MKDTKIQWADTTWNPIRGCSRVSKGCINCYAEKIAARFNKPGLAFEGMTDDKGRWNGVVRMIPDKLGEPLTWRDPKMVFVNSMSDLFHESLSNEEIAAVFGVMAAAPRHTFQVLTKRPERMLEWFNSLSRSPVDDVLDSAAMILSGDDQQPMHEHPTSSYLATMKQLAVSAPQWPLPNVWLGVSVENQQTADERIPLLLQCPAAVRWVSYEPALGGVDFTRLTDDETGATYDSLRGCMSSAKLDTGGPVLDWIVVGGESGQNARSFDVDWAVDVLRQRQETGCRVFVKQLGNRPYRIVPPSGAPDDGGDMETLSFSDSKGGDISEWPKVLQVREWPAKFNVSGGE